MIWIFKSQLHASIYMYLAAWLLQSEFHSPVADAKNSINHFDDFFDASRNVGPAASHRGEKRVREEDWKISGKECGISGPRL